MCNICVGVWRHITCKFATNYTKQLQDPYCAVAHADHMSLEKFMIMSMFNKLLRWHSGEFQSGVLSYSTITNTRFIAIAYALNILYRQLSLFLLYQLYPAIFVTSKQMRSCGQNIRSMINHFRSMNNTIISKQHFQILHISRLGNSIIH